MKKPSMFRTNIYITRRQHDEIVKEAKKKEITFSERFRQIIENYLDNKK